MGRIKKISSDEIVSALANTTRQYFVGELTRPQEIDYYKDDRLEIGISKYPSYQSEVAHVHEVATEYQLMLTGWTQYMDLDTGEVYEFIKGDFYAIEPGTAYAQKVKAGTSILFIKVPSINDKKLVEVDEKQQEWMAQELQTVRTDF